MKSDLKREQRVVFSLMILGLPALSAFFLWLEHVTHFEFLLHAAAIPLEILAGSFLVERWLARKEKEGKRQQLMYLKSYLFRSEMRNVFISNFSARDKITTLEYRSPGAMEEVLCEYAHARKIFHTFMEWAVAHDFEAIFHDMIYILHFIQDFQLYKKQNPERPFMEELQDHPRMQAKVDNILRDGVVKFLDYAIELRQKEPEVLEELLDDYLMSSRIRG